MGCDWHPGTQATLSPRQHLLGHHTDLHSEDTSLLFGWGPLQAHVTAGKFHGELHFDLVRGWSRYKSPRA